MSLVGPRPEVPAYVDAADPLWRSVLRARPGLTDPVTIRLRDEEELLAEAGGDRQGSTAGRCSPGSCADTSSTSEARTWRSDVAVLARTVLAALVPGSVRRAAGGRAG
jgi:lipopolysaccharide/colanic/teichoic acid biosynthesis glycosyltransferase